MWPRIVLSVIAFVVVVTCALAPYPRQQSGAARRDMRVTSTDILVHGN
jgi:hypothetical protein